MNSPAAERPPHPLRWWILSTLFLAMAINLLDRQVLSLVAPVLRDEFHLSNTGYGTIVFCFLLGMTLGQIPIGMMVDRKGARFGLAAIVVFWSIANMLHAFARSTVQFSVLRFFLGVGECGVYSSGVKVIGQWFPARERALASGLFNSGSLMGPIIAPPLVMFLTTQHSWQAAFLVPSAIGILWLMPWFRLYWEPARHPRLSPEERLAVAGSTVAEPQMPALQPSIRTLLALGPVWGVILMRSFGGPVSHFYWYWLPEYLKRERGMSLEMIGLLAWLPFFAGAVGNIGGGWYSGHLVRKGWSVHRARRTVFIAATLFCLSAVFVPIMPGTGSALALICMAALGINAIAANLMGLLGDLFPQAVLARVGGLTGVGDGCISMVMMLLTGIVVDHFSYYPVFIAAGVFPLLTFTALIVLVGTIRPISLEEIMAKSRRTPT